MMLTSCLVMTLGMLGLVVDFGWSHWRREACRTAAQSAVIAAGMAARHANFTCGTGVTCQASTACPATLTSPTADPIVAACLYARQNGFTDGSNGGKQSVRIAADLSANAAPPANGVKPDYWISATIAEKVPQTFSSILGLGWGNVSARATAGVFVSAGRRCLYVLNQSGEAGTNAGGTCGREPLSDDQNRPDPFLGTLGNPGGSASVAPPPADACLPDVVLSAPGTYTIPAGTYCREISVSGSANLILTAGTYSLQEGIRVSGTGTLSATGPVTLYVPGGSVSLTSSGGVELSAPGDGTYAGLLLWMPYTNANGVVLAGEGGQYNGIVYAPRSSLTWSANGASDTTIVCSRITLRAAARFNGPAENSWTGGPARVSLIE